MGTRRVLPTMVGLLVMLAGLPLASPAPASAASPNLVISQVYGGGGNAGATYTHDYIEIFNRGTSAASLADMSLQYASATGTGNLGANSFQLTELPSISVEPGQYILVQESTNAAVGVALPTPDVTDPTPISMSASAGKVALVTGITTLGCNGSTTFCLPDQVARIVDLVGYGNATLFEGAPAPTISASTADLRNAGGCTDTDDNLSDFTAATPAARNSASPLNNCSDAAPFVSASDPADDATGVLVGANIDITFSEPVDVTGAWFDITCATSGAHTARASGGLTTFTLDPDTDFVPLEACTVTVFAPQVADQDATDPPDSMAADFTFDFTTEGDLCSLAFTPIYEIQGDGAAAAITGSLTTQGVVVGDFEGPTTAGLQGFYLQDATGDGDGTTSDGIFVFTANTDNGVAVGDVLRVTGFARERFNQTALNGSNSNSDPVTIIVDCGTAALPDAADVTLPMASATDFERYEGMRVDFAQELVIAEYFNYDRFGELVLALPLAGEDRPFTPTSIEEPGSPEYFARAQANLLSRITLDDGLGSQNPSLTRHPNGDAFTLSNRFRGGDIVQNATGVLGFDFNLYRIQPTGPADYTAVNPRPGSPDPVGGSLQVAAMNTLNFFLTLDTTASDSGPGPCGGNANLDCRGADADQPDEFNRQRDKLLATLAGLGAEVIGLNEMENTPGVDPLGDPARGIVPGLNAMLGAGTYASIDTGVIGTDAIRVGLIYKPGAVSPLGTFEVLDSTDDPRFLDTKSRPALAQTFRVNSTGAVFTVVVNHLKSKGSDCNDVGDPDAGDGQGNCNGTRTLAAQALVDWLATDPTGSGDPDFLVIGDLNSYAMEDPIDAVKAGSDGIAGTGDDYTNLVAQYEGTYAYSYVFDGQAGYLDHALSTSSLTAQVTGATEWHVNADEPDLLDYDTSFKSPAQDALYEPLGYRASDHDPVIVGLNPAPASGTVAGAGVFDRFAFALAAHFPRNSTEPVGSAGFVRSLNQRLVSTGYDWLVVNGNRATLQGTARYNGTPGYGFQLSVIDGGWKPSHDRMRLIIWEADGDVVYDSQPGDPRSAAPTKALSKGNVIVFTR